MKTLVTGSAGFLGRHFVDALDNHGHEVVGADIIDGVDALDVFRYNTTHFDLVIHCAAVAPHRAAIDGHPLAVGAGNLELDAALFQWAARTRPGRIVYLSSSAAYPVWMQTATLTTDLAEHNITFTGEIGAPDAIYGWVKLTGERLARAYREQGGMVTVVRPFSGYGSAQTADFPFGAFRARALAREDPFTVWGDGFQVRDWIHVDDIVAAVLAAVDNAVNGPVNISTGIGTSMADLAALFTREAGYAPTIDFRTDRPAGVAYRVGDPGRLHDFYTPKVTLAEGVRRALQPDRTST